VAGHGYKVSNIATTGSFSASDIAILLTMNIHKTLNAILVMTKHRNV
jgi:hypothetical protein